MKTEHIYIDFHILQTVPPSCVNRDDTGSPKTAVYGGAVRARISSQAQKHAMRLMFDEIFEPSECGKRTKHIVKLVQDRIAESNPELADKAEKLAVKALEGAGLRIKNAEAGTDALFFISDAQIMAVAGLAAKDPEAINDKNNKDIKNDLKAALKESPSIDMALFGRMVAADPSLNWDACAQVAHSISTHRVQNEYDYFTAVDDLAAEDNAGAGHLGTVEFNSSTMYRYATINLTELSGLLGDDTPEAVCGFADAFIRSMPTGKQNTFANRTLPDDVYVTIRRDQPINLCGAFEKPVTGGDGYLEPSEKRLADHARKVYSQFADAPEKAWGIGDGVSELAESVSLKQLLAELKGWIDNEDNWKSSKSGGTEE